MSIFRPAQLDLLLLARMLPYLQGNAMAARPLLSRVDSYYKLGSFIRSQASRQTAKQMRWLVAMAFLIANRSYSMLGNNA